jgi:acyl phosphate:glycerol-3-phosphate acyltransferase
MNAAAGDPTWILLAAAMGYLAGAIPFGLILTRLGGLGDVRAIGSGNIGATNVLRTGNRGLAAATLLLDGGKGAVAVLALADWGVDAALMAGFMAVLGHNFPVWLKFKGGKGVATTLGVLLAVAWPVGLVACVTWLATAVVFRMSSLAALVALALAPLDALWLSTEKVAILAAALALLSIIRHRANIRRILKGEEPKIGKKKPEQTR